MRIWWESDSQSTNAKVQILWRRARKLRAWHFARCSDTHWYGTDGKIECVLDDACDWLWYLVILGWYLDSCWHHQGKEQSGDWDRARHSSVGRVLCLGVLNIPVGSWVPKVKPQVCWHQILCMPFLSILCRSFCFEFEHCSGHGLCCSTSMQPKIGFQSLTFEALQWLPRSRV